MSGTKWVVAVGSMFHAIDLYGAFDFHDDADTWARHNIGENGWAVQAMKTITGEAK